MVVKAHSMHSCTYYYCLFKKVNTKIFSKRSTLQPVYKQHGARGVVRPTSFWVILFVEGGVSSAVSSMFKNRMKNDRQILIGAMFH